MLQLALHLLRGGLQLIGRIGGVEGSVSTGSARLSSGCRSVNDGYWHTVSVVRRGATLQLSVDDCPPHAITLVCCRHPPTYFALERACTYTRARQGPH